ncbi:aprataxin and PNK-like factor [Rhinoraja longicauda]
MMLEAVDGSCAVLELPAGITTIGRGPLLAVSDKRVSRNHGLLELLDETLRIKPIHDNLCFLQSSDGDDFMPLEKDKWHWLNPGDCFSLLPDKYIYKVISSNSDQTLRNSDLSSLEDDQCDSENLPIAQGMLKKDSEESEDYTEKPTKSTRTVSKDSTEKSNAFEPSNVLENMSKNEQPKNGNSLIPEQRTRVLPAWMLQGVKEIQSTSSSINKQGKGRGRGRGEAEQTKDEVTRAGRKRNESSENDEGNEVSEQPLEKKGRRKKTEASENGKHANDKSNAVENNFGTTSTHVKREEEIKDRFSAASEDEENWPLGGVKGGRQQSCGPQPPHEVRGSAMSDNEEEEEEAVGLHCGHAVQKRLPPVHVQGACSVSRSPAPEGAEPAGHASTSQAKEQKRKVCAYGSSCYRKNPVHFQEFSHPGDADYEDAPGREEDDDKPECPFGTACYRKNPQHKKEYKHILPPESQLRRPRRKVAQKGKGAQADKSDDDGEPNQYDLEESFIDDEEDDLDPTDEDSDWEPSSDINEDIDTLRKEANRFVNKH